MTKHTVVMLKECQPGDVFEARDTKVRALVVAVNDGSVVVKREGAQRPIRWARRTEGRVLTANELQKEAPRMTKQERKGVRGARLTIASAVRQLKRIEFGKVTGAEAETALNTARGLINDGLAILDGEAGPEPVRVSDVRREEREAAEQASTKAPRKRSTQAASKRRGTAKKRNGAKKGKRSGARSRR